jgi:triacylglycerol lipase
MLTSTEAAELALLVNYAMDQYQADPTSLAPTPDPRLSPKWRVLGYLTATDSLFRAGQTVELGDTVCYGYLAQVIEKPDVYVAAIRGTNGILEWIEDAQFLSVPHPAGGTVEQGFYGIYRSMQYRPIGGEILPAARGVSNAVGKGSLIVLGHSLGSALATYLTFDLAHPGKLGPRVQGCFYASPRTGNADFVKVFDERVQTYSLWNYELDVVPRVPFGPDYTDLTRCTWIETDAAQARIRFDLTCHHHIVVYAAMLNYALLNWQQMPAADCACAACIKGAAAPTTPGTI